MISSAGGEGIVVRTYWVEHKITMIFQSTPRHLQFRAIECMIVWRHMYGNTFAAVGAVKGMPLGCHLNCDWFCKGLRTVKYEGIRSSYPNLTTWEMSHGRRYQADFQHAWLPPLSLPMPFPFPGQVSLIAATNQGASPWGWESLYKSPDVTKYFLLCRRLQPWSSETLGHLVLWGGGDMDSYTESKISCCW